MQIGRVQGGTIGVLGQDGAWADDHRFHPISPNAYTGERCSPTDANGHAFDNVSVYEGIASADVVWGNHRQAGMCIPAGTPGYSRGRYPTCPPEDLRDLDYGLLGPDAVSITYRDTTGREFTEPTVGLDGAYLIVSRSSTAPCVKPVLPPGERVGRASCSRAGGQSAGAPAGVITSVTYRDGHVCRLPPPQSGTLPQATCPPVGYRPAPVVHPTAAQLASPIAVRKLPAKHYCVSGRDGLAPCRVGQKPVPHEHGLLLVTFSFTARVPVTNVNSEYEFSDSYPPRARCRGGSGGATDGDIRAGQRVVFQDQIPELCVGIVSGTVSYVPLTPDTVPADQNAAPGQSVIVGRFSFRMP